VAVVLLVVVWAVGVANLTLFVASGIGPRNAIPFRTIGGYLLDGHLPLQIRVRNLAGNVVMLAPLGLALAAVTRWRQARVALCVLVVSGTIEAWQLLAATGRSVDIDDVILNVAGGLIGWLAGLALLWILEVAAPGALETAEAGVGTRSVDQAQQPAFASRGTVPTSPIERERLHLDLHVEHPKTSR
jgi:hypothetical protein